MCRPREQRGFTSWMSLDAVSPQGEPMFRLSVIFAVLLLLAGCAVAPSHAPALTTSSQDAVPAVAASTALAATVAPASSRPAAVGEHAPASHASQAYVPLHQIEPAPAMVSPGSIAQPAPARQGMGEMPPAEASVTPPTSSPPSIAPISPTTGSARVLSRHVTASQALRPSSRVNLSGVVQLVAMTGQQIDAQDMADTVVYFIPDAGAPHPHPGTYTIDMHHRMFHPSMLVIPLGSTVSFPNRDKYLHNVFSVTPGSQFNLGLQGYGQAGQHTFTKSGLVLVNCNVHPSMQATILVVATPYIARPAANGQFNLKDLPPGPGVLTVWQPRAGSLTRHIVLPLTTRLSLRVVISQPRLLPHARLSSVFPDAGAR